VPALIDLVTKGQALLPFSGLLPGLERFRRAAEFEDSLRAVAALGEMGPAAKDAVPSLSRLLRHPIAWARVQSAEALVGIAPEGSQSFKKGVDTLTEAVSSADGEARGRAVKVLGKIGPPAGNAVSALVPLLEDKGMPFDAAEALGKIGAPAVPALLKNLENPLKRKYAVITLGKVGPTAKDAIPALARIMKDPVLSPSVLEVQTEAIKTLGKLAQAALPVLIAFLRDKNPSYSHEVRGALVSMGPAAVPELIRLLQDPDPSLRNHAAECLGFIRPAATETAIALALAVDDPEVQKEAVRSLGNLGPTAKAAISALSRALWDLSRGDEYSVAVSLRKIGPEAAAALAQSLKHPIAEVRSVASYALVEMGSVAVRPVAQILRDPNEGIQMVAEAVLLRMGPEAVPELRKVAAEVPELQSRIEKTLRQIQEG